MSSAVQPIRNLPKTQHESPGAGECERSAQPEHALAKTDVPKTRFAGGEDDQLGSQQIHSRDVLACEQAVVRINRR